MESSPAPSDTFSLNHILTPSDKYKQVDPHAMRVYTPQRGGSRYKEKFHSLRDKFDKVVKTNEENQKSLDFALSKLRELESENNLLLDALGVATGVQDAIDQTEFRPAYNYAPHRPTTTTTTTTLSSTTIDYPGPPRNHHHRTHDPPIVPGRPYPTNRQSQTRTHRARHPHEPSSSSNGVNGHQPIHTTTNGEHALQHHHHAAQSHHHRRTHSRTQPPEDFSMEYIPQQQ